MSPRTKAILSRFAQGTIAAEIPITIALLSNPNADWRFALAALLGGVGAAYEKYVSPQLATDIIPDSNAATSVTTLSTISTEVITNP